MSNDRIMVTKGKIDRIGDAIREKTGSSDTYTLDEMPEAIRAIQTGGGGVGAQVTVTTETEEFYGLTVSLTNGTDTITSKFSNEGVAIFTGVEWEGELTVSVTYEEETYSTAVQVKSRYNAELNSIPKIYGAEWTIGQSPAMTRTDLAKDFADPVAAINNGTGSSPFDTIAPWSEIIKVEDPEAGILVKIPKFYFKLTFGAKFKIQISPKMQSGFSVCPACADRRDGKGERDYIFVGRHLSAVATYTSSSGVAPANYNNTNDLTRANARRWIHNIGSTIWQWDYAAYITLFMLYLVEYANWDSTRTIGRGGINGYYTPNTGRTDAMQYHTGTNAATRDGVGNTQYRWVEDLWSNREHFVDGIRCDNVPDGNDNLDVYIISNPSDFSDTENGVKVIQRNCQLSGCVDAMIQSNVNGYEWVFTPSHIYNPSASEAYHYYYATQYTGGGYNTTYKPILCVGNENGEDNEALGFLIYRWYDSTSPTRSCRLMKLP